jgi:hypothetical protein
MEFTAKALIPDFAGILPDYRGAREASIPDEITDGQGEPLL